MAWALLLQTMASGNTVDVKSRFGDDLRRFTVQRDLHDYQVSLVLHGISSLYVYQLLGTRLP